MFKKIALSVALGLLPIGFFNVNAAEIKGVGENVFYQSSNNQAFTAITVLATSNNEITKKNGLTIMIPSGSAIQWDTGKNDQLKISGSAANKVLTPVAPVISENMYYLTIALTDNLLKGEQIVIEGLTPRTYRERMGERFLQIDINGDFQPDAGDFYSFSVRVDDKSDFIKPHPVSDASLKYNNDLKRVELRWKNPKDYDYAKTIVSKKLGAADIELYSGTDDFAYDKNYIDGQQVIYDIFTNDKEGNWSKQVSLQYPLPEQEKEEEVQPEFPVEPEPEAPKEKEESTEDSVDPKDSDSKADVSLDELKRLQGYYKIRHQIKCLREGVNPKGGNCLWAKVNLIYAQKMLKESTMDASLSSDDLRIIGKRLKFSEKRYQDYCQLADEPAAYCEALGENLKRAQFFLNQK